MEFSVPSLIISRIAPYQMNRVVQEGLVQGMLLAERPLMWSRHMKKSSCASNAVFMHRGLYSIGERG